jgi:hypothetical protein
LSIPALHTAVAGDNVELFVDVDVDSQTGFHRASVDPADLEWNLRGLSGGMHLEPVDDCRRACRVTRRLRDDGSCGGHHEGQ